MNLEVRRQEETSRSIIGELWIDGQKECFTLEPARTNPVNSGHPCIAAGTYPAILTPSPHLGYLTPELENVPGRSDIRIHIGNFPRDTEGCTLVGSSKATDWISGSKTAFAKLMTLLKTADKITITYIDPVLK